MQNDNLTRRRLDPFVFPAETNVRFLLLIIAAAVLAWILGQAIQNMLAVEGILTIPIEESFPSVELEDGLDTLIGAYFKLMMQSLARLLVPIAAVFLVFVLAIMIYRLYPSFIRRRNRLLMVNPDEKPSLLTNVQTISSMAGVPHPPTVEIDKESRSTEGQVFGFHNKYSLRLGGRMKLLMVKAPEKFRAIILHELGHIINRDVGRTYFAQSLWVATISLLLVPLFGIQFSVITMRGIKELIRDGLESFDWSNWLTVVIPLNLMWIFQTIISLGVVASIRSSILRIREIYADWRAALWGAEDVLYNMFSKINSKEKRGFWRHIFRLHPMPQERFASLRNPINLFRFKYDIPVLAGFLLALLIVGFIPLAFELFLFAMGITTIAALVPMQSFVESANLLENVLYFLLGTFGQVGGFIISIIVGLAFLLLVAYLMVGTIGMQVRRECIADMVTNCMGFKNYMRLLLPSALIAISLQIGFIIVPYAMISPIGIYIVDRVSPLLIFRDVLLMLLWIVSVTGLTWLWLVYTRFFSIRLFGEHISASAPKMANRILVLTSSVLLWILYLPAVAGYLQISYLITGDPEVFPPYVLPILLAISLALYPAVFGATFLLVQARRWFSQSSCPSCGRQTNQRVAIGQMCVHCGRYLSPWLFIESQGNNK